MNATALTFDDVFASSGFFGVEIAPDVAVRAGERVTVRGYLYGPLSSGERDYAFARGSLRYCPCCSGEPSYGDDLVLVRLRAPMVLDAHAPEPRIRDHGDARDRLRRERASRPRNVRTSVGRDLLMFTCRRFRGRTKRGIH